MTIFSKLRSLTVLGTIILAFAGSIFAQAGTGGIAVSVTDSAGAVVPNATVTLTSKATNQTQTATTSNDGLYTFVSLQPGTYAVKTTASNFGEQTLNVEVQVGRTTDANVTLGASGVAAEVTVTAEGIQTTQSNSDAVITEAAISNLPINGRRFQDFATLTPTAQVDPSRGQISLSGQRGINGNVNVDGVDFNQPFFGGIRGGERSNSSFTIPQESIKEFNVVAAGYNAEFGRSTGGIINVVTKSGSNQLRGSAFYQIRPQELARPHSFADALEEQSLGPRGLDATLAPTLQQFGGSIGGPIISDKLFYFGTYEQQRFRAPRQVLYPTLNGLTATPAQTEVFNLYKAEEVPFEQTNDAYAALGKIDWVINDANRFNTRFNYSSNKALNGVSTGETSFDPTTSRSLGTNGTENDENWSTVSQLVSNFSASLFNDLRVQYAREERPREANELSPNIFTGIGELGTRNFLPTTQYDTRLQFADAMTWVTGNHTMKFGGEYSRIFAQQLFGFGQTGEYSLSLGSSASGIQNTLNQTSSTRAGTYLGRFDTTSAVYRQQIGNLQAEMNVQELAFFAQDQWRITPSFTLNFGLRAEQQYNPDPDVSNTDLVNLVRNASFPLAGGGGIDPTTIPDSGWQWGPRLGFAWDPTGEGKTVIRGFGGVYYARTPLLLLADSINNYRLPPGNVRAILGSGGVTFQQAAFNTFLNTPAAAQYIAITGCVPNQTPVNPACVANTIYRQFAILGINLNTVAFGNLPTLTPTQVQTIGSAVNSSFNPNIINGIQVTSHDPEFKNPESVQFGFGAEHEFVRNFVVGVDYSQVRTNFLQKNVDYNLPAPVLNAGDPSGRPLIGVTRPQALPASVSWTNRARPITSLSSVQVRESSGRSFFQALTFRTRITRSWALINAYYTLSRNESDDDNERDSGGVLYTNPYDRRAEFGPSRLDRTHQFVANPVFFMPYGFEVSSAIRLRSGLPFNSQVGSDMNGDGLNNDRPYLVPGVELPRNYFRNRNVFDVDLRVQKGFSFGERMRLIGFVEFFNIFNMSNTQYGGAQTNYCNSSTENGRIRCGLDGITNTNFSQVRNASDQIILSNNPGSQVFQMQLGGRFQF
ncbi:MAG: carboxypeptidase regulatory-like domain-containing protein [bacterium]|nr:carboxypeptidase regulatory-like domain-containing protein [bacterium]